MAALARAGEKHFLALERQRAELMGSQEEAVAARAASERDGRVEMIRKQAARRLQRQGVLRGWEAWQAAAQEATRQKRLMQGAAARLARPTQLAVITALRDNWQSERQRASSRSARGELQVISASACSREDRDHKAFSVDHHAPGDATEKESAAGPFRD